VVGLIVAIAISLSPLVEYSSSVATLAAFKLLFQQCFNSASLLFAYPYKSPRKNRVRISEGLGTIKASSIWGKSMVRKDPTQQFVIVLSTLLFLGIVGVTTAHRFMMPATSPDPIATYGTQGR
jgi:hypothetical protein